MVVADAGIAPGAAPGIFASGEASDPLAEQLRIP